MKPIFKGSKLFVYKNILNKNIYIKYYNHFYNVQIVSDKVGRSEKIRAIKIENQKILEQVLKERDERLKARANKVSS